MGEATRILSAIESGNPTAAEDLLPLVYAELRKLAALRLAQEKPGQTLQATALVHEAWLKLAGGGNNSFKDRTHFFSAAAEAMRHILIDRARRKQARRHGGGMQKVDFDDIDIAAPAANEQLVAMDEALTKMTASHPAQAEVVKLRYFVGLTNEEVAELLGISISTVKNYWNFSRAWLFNEISRA